MTHRYSFDTDARDSVGSADGALKGAAVIQQGAVVFDGTNSGVQLPNNLFTNYTSTSIELWVVDETASLSASTSTLFSFKGTSNYLTYNNSFAGPGGGTHGAVRYYTESAAQIVYCPVIPVGQTNHFVWSQDAASRKSCIYLNGILASQNTNFTATPAGVGPTTNNWLGSDGAFFKYFRGRILEFRIYNGAISSDDVAFHEAASPDLPNPDPGPLQQIRIEVPAVVGLGSATRPAVWGDYAALTNVNLLGQTALRLASGNPEVLSLITSRNTMVVITNRTSTNVEQGTATMKVLARSAGSARLTAQFANCTASADIAVRTGDQAGLIHRYAFNEPVGATVVHDQVGSFHGRVWGGTFTGKGELTLNWGWVTLPPGVLSGLVEVSIESWVTWTYKSVYYPWQMIFDFGDQEVTGSDASGKTYFCLTPMTGPSSHANGYFLRSTITTNSFLAEFPRLDWTNTLPLNVTSHLAVTYSFPHRSAALFLNGQLVATVRAALPLGGINDLINMLGGSVFPQDPSFAGRFNEFRIYNGLLHHAEVAASYQAGQDTLLPAATGFQISPLAPDPLETYHAALRALVRRDAVPTSVFFQYGTNTNLEITTDTVDVGAGVDQVEASVPITNLSKLTRYYFRAATIRAGTTNFGNTVTFSTTNDIVTLPISKVSVGSAWLQGMVAPKGQTVSVYFEYGPDFTNSTAPIVVSGGPELVPFETEIGNLLPNTVYDCRAVLSTPAGPSYGTTEYFQTAAPIRIQSVVPQGSETRITFNALGGIPYALVGSSDLVTWTELTNAIPEITGTFSLSDYNSGQNGVRFYRIRTP